MRKFNLKPLMVPALACAVMTGANIAADSPSAQAQGHKKIHAVILLDTSGSNPIVSPDAGRYAANVALMFDRRLPKLTAGSRISFETFGEYDVKRQIRKELIVNIKNRPRKVRASLKHLIRNIPAYIKKGTIATQGATNIIASLHDLSERLQCQRYETHVFVLTDGIESSIYAKMPKGNPEMFKGCKAITFIGVTGGNAKQTALLKQLWTRWSRESGFEAVQTVR